MSETPKLYPYRNYIFYVVFSPDEDGYYAEICNRDGEMVHQTKLKRIRASAFKDARTWIKLQ